MDQHARPAITSTHHFQQAWPLRRGGAVTVSSREAILGRLMTSRASARLPRTDAPAPPPPERRSPSECLLRFHEEATALGIECFVELSADGCQRARPTTHRWTSPAQLGRGAIAISARGSRARRDFRTFAASAAGPRRGRANGMRRRDRRDRVAGHAFRTRSFTRRFAAAAVSCRGGHAR